MLRILPLSLGNPLGPHVVAVRKNANHPPAIVAILEALKALASASDASVLRK